MESARDPREYAGDGGTVSNRSAAAAQRREILSVATPPLQGVSARLVTRDAFPVDAALFGSMRIEGGAVSPGAAAALAQLADLGVVGFAPAASPPVAAAPSARAWRAPTAPLRNVGEASFGPPPPVAETVMGPDDRRLVTTTTAFPWSAIASLLVVARDGSSWLGTGWFIGRRTVITAGHVVYIRSNVPGRSGFAKSITVIPGRAGELCPLGVAKSAVFHTHENWVNHGDPDFDYGAIILPADADGAIGSFGFGSYTDAELRSTPVTISGYPAENTKPTGTQWWDVKPIEALDNHRVYYETDTSGGQSGAPVFRLVDGQPYAVAVHAYGSPNFGVRIDEPMYQNLQRWQSP
ncbi:MAG: trypsin-like peptidase domain-containing protein [Byssovorax sp.]